MEENSTVVPASVSLYFPNGLRVLVVDDDQTCLMVIEKMLSSCNYIVTACQSAITALAILRERTGAFDIVITDVHMPEMDGFMLLERIGLEMDLPVIMLSSDIEQSVAMRGLEHGACFYMTKPAAMDDLKNIWQFAVRRRRRQEIEQKGSDKGKEAEEADKPEDGESASSMNEEENSKGKKKKKKRSEKEERAHVDSDHENEESRRKKDRVVWHAGLHNQFLAAVNLLGLEKAVPKKILEIMNVPGLTRENVASHLQKYRMFLRRMSDENEIQPIPGPFFLGTSKSVFARSFQAMITTPTPTPSPPLVGFPSHTPQVGNYNFGSGRPNTVSMNPQGNLPSMLLGAGRNFQQNLSQSFQNLPPNYMNSAPIPSARDFSNTQMMNQQNQVGGGVFAIGPHGNFARPNFQQWNDHPRMGREAPPPQTAAQTSNYPMSCDELQQLRGGPFFDILRLQSQSGTQATRGVSTNFNLLNEMNRVETTIGTQMPKNSENVDFGSLLAAADGGNMMTTFTPMTGTNEEFINNFEIVGQQQHLVGVDDEEEMLKWSSSDQIATIPTHEFSDPDFDDLVFKEVEDEASWDHSSF